MLFLLQEHWLRESQFHRIESILCANNVSILSHDVSAKDNHVFCKWDSIWWVFYSIDKFLELCFYPSRHERYCFHTCCYYCSICTCHVIADLMAIYTVICSVTF